MAQSAWQQYLDYLIGRGNVEYVMVVDSADCALWVTSSNDDFYLKEYQTRLTEADVKPQTVNEATNLLQILGGSTPAAGLRVSGRKYEIEKDFVDPNTGLRVVHGRGSQGGIAIVNAGRCLLVGTYATSKSHSASACFETLQVMGNYLSKSTWPDTLASNTNVGLHGARTGSSNNSSNNSNPTAAPAAATQAAPAPASAAPAASVARPSASSGQWQTLLESKLMNRDSVLKAMICSKEDGKPLAASDNFTLMTYQAEIAQEDGSDKLETVDEPKNLATLMSGRKPSQGLRIEQTKYQILRTFEDDESKCYTVYGKKTLGGCSLAVTNKVIILALFDEKSGHTAAQCNEAVADLARVLKTAKS